MTEWKTSLHQNLLQAYKGAYPSENQSIRNSNVSKIWQRLKKEDTFPTNVREEIRRLKDISTNRKGSVSHYFAKICEKQAAKKAEVEVLDEKPVTPVVLKVSQNEPEVPAPSAFKKATPVQDALKTELASLTDDLDHLIKKRDKGLATDDQLESIKVLQKKTRLLSKKIKLAKSNQVRQQRLRDKQKALLKDLRDKNPEAVKLLHKRAKPGRPRYEEDHEGLLTAIKDIALYGSLAHDRRRSEEIRTVKTLDELTEALRLQGYHLSRSGVYLRLLPRNASTTEGKRHVFTVPVKLCRAMNDLHKEHSDTLFCKQTIGYLEELASILGPDSVLFLSQDDRARVPLAITAANKQCPILMRVDYKIKLPDHDWVIAERHKLIPSVYGFIEIQPNCFGDKTAVGYSGPTYVAIRSGKHSSSTAYSHANDFDFLMQEPSFFDFTQTTDGKAKPVLIITVDGGPDENPRYTKVIEMAIAHFQKYDLDAVFLATNAPGRSAYNRVERRMAPLSRELSGLILPHNHFGSHLDDKGATVDTELEKRNFEHAGKILAEIWSNTEIDGHQTLARYIDPNEKSRQIPKVTPDWRTRHIREGHYSLQIAKCKDRSCCSEPRSSIFNILGQFLPAPLFVSQGHELQLKTAPDGNDKFSPLMLRLKLNDDIFKRNNFEVPYDICCPSVQELISARCCKGCGLYHSSQKNMKDHIKTCLMIQSAGSTSTNKKASVLSQRQSNRPVRAAARRQQERMVVWSSRLNDPHVDWFEDEELEGVEVSEHGDPVSGNNTLPILSIDDYMKSPWEDA